MSKIPSESDEQRTLVRWLAYKRIAFFSVPNGGPRTGRHGWRLRDEGMSAGVPDLIVVTPPPDGSGRAVGLELKRRSGGVVSEAQAHWRDTMIACGWAWVLAYGADDAIDQLEAMGY